MRRDASKQLVCLLPIGCCLVLTAASGCNNGKQLQADLYQRELRLQEDEIYRLEDYIEEYQGLLRGYRCEVADLKRQLASTHADDASTDGPKFSPGAAPRRDEEPDADDDGEFLPAPDADEAPAFSPSPAEEEAPFFELGAADRRGGRTRLASLDREPTPAPALLKLGDLDSLRVVVRNGAPAADGAATLVAAVTPLSEGAPAYFEGEASVLLADIAGDGPMRRLARWDFTADEVEAAWVESGAAARLELPLLAPGEVGEKTPVGRPIRVWVRLVDSHGQKTLRSIEAEFAAAPFRVLEREPIALTPRRLPPPEPEAVAVSAPDEESDRDWRRALPGRLDRSVRDDRVAPASYVEAGEEAGEEKGRGAAWRGATAR